MSKNYFKIFVNCIIVEGCRRSLILDGQRDYFTTIPNTLLQIINLFKSKISLEEIIVLYGIENKKVINEYLDFLIENEFGFFSSFEEFDLFPEINTQFEIASQITNCIVEISDLTILNIKKIIIGLEIFNCKNLQLVSYDYIDVTVLKKLLEATNNSNFRSIEFVLKYSYDIFNFIDEIDENNFMVTDLLFHSCENEPREIKKKTFDIKYLKKKIIDFKNCGIVDIRYFNNVNKYKVFESISHNSCLHKKISINKDGNIKNCPSMPQSFGNIKDTSLERALDYPEFKKYWNITKDQIDVCKDCEFRHICTDCRAYIEEPDNQYSKPLKCGYCPYTNIWEKWSTNPLKQKAIEYYGMQDLINEKG